MKHTALLISTVIILAGCTAATPSVSEYTILPSATPRHAHQEPLSSASLRISTIKALPSLSSKSLYYLREGHESGAYLYSRWSDTPASMIQRVLTSSLEEQRVYAVLLPSASSAQANHVLESDLAAFYHRFHADGTSEGYIDITFYLVDAHTKKTLGSRRFTLTAKAPTADAEGGVSALAEATRELGSQCTRWLILQTQEQP